MLDSMRHRYHSVRRRVRQIERQEIREFRRWLEDTENLLHLSALILVPLLIGAITWLSNVSHAVPFLVYPPLAAGTYTLFANPEGRYSSPRKFAGGMTAGALSGWIALETTARFWYTISPEQFHIHAWAAALGIFLTGVVTWGLELEEPTAFSSALLVLVTGSEQLTYIAGIAVSSLLVAGIFVLWRRRFYHERARYLFQSTQGNDQILVPIRGDCPDSLALFAARLAAAHDAGKVVLMETVSAETIEETESEMETAQPPGMPEEKEDSRDDNLTRAAEEQITEQRLDRLGQLQDRIETVVDVPCEFVVVAGKGSAGNTVLKTADEENCDLIISSYESKDGHPTPFVRKILTGNTDAIVLQSTDGCTEWHRILVMVRSSGEIANAMLDFAHRLLTTGGTISACTCISQRLEQRDTELMLHNLVEPFSEPVETRISRKSVEQFLEANTLHYDLVVMGASTDRSAASRFVSTPTFERIRDVDCDLAIIHRD